MSTGEKPSGEALEGVPKYARLALLALVAVAQAVPGYSILSGDDWHPPGMGPVFTVTAVIVGAGTIGILFTARKRVLAMRARVVVAWCGAALLLCLGLMAAYRAVLDARVVHYAWAEREYRELIPLGTSRWTGPVLLRRIRAANDGAPRSAAAVRPSHLRRTLEEYGPEEVREHFPDGWRIVTQGVLWTQYLAVLALVAGAFGVAAVRLGHEITPARPAGEPSASVDASKPPAAAASQAAEGSAEVPEKAADGVPAEAWEKRVAELEAELRRVRAQLGNGGPPSRNGHPREPLVVRAEIRTSGWLLLGAAAMVWWMGGRERERGGGTRR
jgi:hypothetical protein